MLKRPKELETKTLSRRDIDTVLSDLAAVVRQGTLAYRWRPTLSDLKDDLVFEAATIGGANSIIAFNTEHFAGGGRNSEFE